MDISASNLEGNYGAAYKGLPGEISGAEHVTLHSAPSLVADQLIEEYRQIQRNLSIPPDLRLPRVDLLFKFISGEQLGDTVKIDSGFNHAYLTKRPKYGDGIVFLINHETHGESAHKVLDKLIAEQFNANPSLGKILVIPIETPSMTDVLRLLGTKPKDKLERDLILNKIQGQLKIGTTKRFYPPHKKYYENHVELIMSKLFKTVFKRLERISDKNLDLFIYQINNKHLILDLEDLSQRSSEGGASRSVSVDNLKPNFEEKTLSRSKEKILDDLQKKYRDSVILELRSSANRPIGDDFEIADYKRCTTKKQDEIHLSAFTSDNFYQLKLVGASSNINSLTANASSFDQLKAEFDNYLPESNALRGEGIIAALFNALGTEVKHMSQNPGHRYDIKVHNKGGLKSPLKLLSKGKEEVLIEVKTAMDDYPSIRSLTVNQALRFNALKKNQQAIVAKVVLADSFQGALDKRVKIDELFKDYPPQFVENEDGFALLKPDPSKSKDRSSPYNKIYLFDFNELKSKNPSSKHLSSPATIGHLTLSLNLKVLKEKILKSKGKEIDLNKLDSNILDLERNVYFMNLARLRNVENKLKIINQNDTFKEHGFASVFSQRNSLREERAELMQNLLITQLKKHSPFANLELSEFPSRFDPSLRPRFTTANPDVNEHIFVFKNMLTGEIKPCELMFFSEADPNLKLTQSHLLDRSISSLGEGKPLKLPVRIAFYNAKTNKIHLFKESLPEKLMKNLAEEFSSLANVKKGVHYIKDSLFRSIEPIALNLRPEKMLKHSFR